MTEAAIARALSLPCFAAPTDAALLEGGITNFNVVLTDQGRMFMVRIGEDILHHGVMRWNELSVSRAAAMAGLSPDVVYHEPGVMVLDFVEATALSEPDVTAAVPEVVELITRCHRDVAAHLRGPVLTFWVFHVLRDYAATLRDNRSAHAAALPGLMAQADALETAVGPVNLVLGHNDLLAANILRAPDRLWLIDWEYGGFNSPLFDLGGLATNNGLSARQERAMLEQYFDRTPDDTLWRSYSAMKCASLLRETMWSMVSEIFSPIDFDYAAYTAENRARFDAAHAAFAAL